MQAVHAFYAERAAWEGALGAKTGAVTVGQRVGKLTAVRRQLRLARSEVAPVVGVSYATIWAWETGKRRPRGRSLAELRKFLATREGDGDP